MQFASDPKLAPVLGRERLQMRALVAHPLTDRGLELFLADWKKTGQRIV